MEKRFYTIQDMTVLLGKSVAAIHAHLHRKQFDAVPPPTKLGRRLAWSVEFVEEWIKQKNLQAHIEHERQQEMLKQPRKPGRPTKVEARLRRGYV
jgi:Predicted transcriptional regulator